MPAGFGLKQAVDFVRERPIELPLLVRPTIGVKISAGFVAADVTCVSRGPGRTAQTPLCVKTLVQAA